MDVPELGFTSEPNNEKGNKLPSGELCAKSLIEFFGYYKNIEETE